MLYILYKWNANVQRKLRESVPESAIGVSCVSQTTQFAETFPSPVMSCMSFLLLPWYRQCNTLAVFVLVCVITQKSTYNKTYLPFIIAEYGLPYIRPCLLILCMHIKGGAACTISPIFLEHTMNGARVANKLFSFTYILPILTFYLSCTIFLFLFNMLGSRWMILWCILSILLMTIQFSEKLKRFFVYAVILYTWQRVVSYEPTARVSGVRFSR